MVRLNPHYSKFQMTKSDTVLDIGAHIGTFAVTAAWKAKKVIAVEMDFYNFEILEFNSLDWSNIVPIHGAVVPQEQAYGEVKYYNAPYNTASASLFLKRGDGIPVNTIAFEDLVMIYKPSIIKCDAQGIEFDLFGSFKMPKYVKQIVIEMHFMFDDWRLRLSHLQNFLKFQGFRFDEITISEIRAKRITRYFERL
jgi:FkbM family methyltransferase